MRNRSIIISTLCLLLALPGGALAETDSAQTPQPIKVETGTQVKAAVSSTSIAALSEDIFGPELESATVSPTQVGVGESITITAKATDPSEVTRIDAYLNLPDSEGFRGYKILPLVLDTESGDWKGTYTIKDYDLEGTWMIDFDLYDGLGNQSYSVDDDYFEVVNPDGGDTEFPTYVGASVTPLNVAVNQEVTIKAKVSDNIGVDRVEAAIYTGDNNGLYNVPLTLNPTTKEWEGSHSFSEDDIPGTWYVDIDFFDAAGNFTTKMLEDELTLSNPDRDFTGPVIGEAVATPKSASPGDSVQISVPVSDGQSGVNSVFAEVFHIDDPLEIKYVYLTLDPSSGKWIGDFKIESGFQSGVWNVFIQAIDNVGNTGVKEFAASFDVINTNGDFDAPIFSSVEVTPQGDVNIGESVTFTAKVSDNVGVDSVYANIDTQGEYDELLLMSYDAENEQWVGKLDILETTAPGFYQVYFTAYDAAFNVNWAYAAGGFTVINPEGDHTGPVISAVELDKTEVNAGENVTISATVTDTESGVAEVTAIYNEHESIALTYNSTLNKWIGSITVQKNVPDEQVIKINLVEAVDLKGNQTVIYDPASFQVHNPDGDFIAPVIKSFEMTPSTVKQGETVHFEAKLVDAESGIKSATVYWYNDTDLNETTVDLTYDAVKEVWTADFVVPATSGFGTYSVGLDFEDHAGNRVNATFDQKLQIIEETVESEQYNLALWYYENNNLYNTVYFAGMAISEGDQRPEVQELMNDAAQALFDAAADMSGADAENAYQLLIATTGVPTPIKEAAQAKVTPEVNSPNYLEAVWYYDNSNYYNAVHYLGAAIAEGDTNPAVQDLMNIAAQALLEEAAGTDNLAFAGDAYNLLIATTGVPTPIKEEATAKLAVEVNSTNYPVADWYFANGNHYNAVHFAGAAIAEGNTRPEVQELLNNAAQALVDQAGTESIEFAGNAYDLLIATTGVPTSIKEEAAAKLAVEVNSTNYPVADWYFANGNHYNAVHFAGAAIAEGNTRPEVQDLMNSAAQALLDAAATMSPVDALNAYSLLVNTTGVPEEIKAAAQAKLSE